MQIVSAYLLAASAVDNGNYDEDYDTGIDELFEEYMDIGGDDIVDDYIEINAPTGGSTGTEFSGSTFCSDWVASMSLPIEVAKIYAQRAGLSTIFPSTDSSSDWGGFKVWSNAPEPAYRGMFIPQALDQHCYNSNNKHINMWFAGFSYYPRYGEGNFAPCLFGVYAGQNVSFKCISNQPTKGFASFSFRDNTGNIGLSLNYQWYSHQWDVGGDWAPVNNGGQEDVPNVFILVYNKSVFLNYMKTINIDELFRMNSYMYILAECNVTKSKV